MDFHILTIVLMIAISNGISVILFLAQYYLNKKFSGMFYWVLAFSLLAISQILGLFNAIYSIQAIDTSSDLTIAFGFMCISLGVKKYLNVKINFNVFIGIYSILILSCIALHFHHYLLIQQSILLIIMAVYSIFIIKDFYQKFKLQNNKIAFFIAVLFALYTIIFLVQAITNLFTFKNPPPIEDNITLTVVYIASLVMSIFATFGFMLLINQQLIFSQSASETALLLNSQILLDAQQIANIGSYVHHLKDNTWQTSIVFNKIFGISLHKQLTVAEGAPLLTEKYINWVNDIVSTLKKAYPTQLTLDFKINKKNDRNTYWLNGNGKLILDEDGSPLYIIGTIQDITERKEIEEKIIEKNIHFEILFNSSPEAAMISLIPSGTILDTNQAFVKLSGFSNKEVIGKTTIDLNVWNNLEERETTINYIKANGFITKTEIKFKRKDGVVRHCNYSGKLCNINGVPHLISLIEDITDRKAIEESLHLNKYAISNASDAVFWVRSDASFFEMNIAACKLFGYTKEALLQMSVLEIDPNFDTQKWNKHWLEVKTKKNLTITSTSFTKTKELIVTEINANYIELNGIELMCSFVRNITERKKAEYDKELTRLDHEALISSTNDYMWSVNNKYELIAGNKAFINQMQKNTGISLKSGDNLMLEDTFSEVYLTYWKNLYNRALQGEFVQEEIIIPDENNTDNHWSELNVNPIYNNNEITGIACYSKDITERKNQENKLIILANELQKRADELAETNIELEQFAYIASHDLQEPLRMVKSFLELIERRYGEKLDEDGLKYIKYAVQGSDRMKQVILDLLNYSRVGKGDDEIEKLDLNEILSEVIETNQLVILEKQAVITKEQLPTIQFVRLHMQQLLHNLITNGLKYCKPNVVPILNISFIDKNKEWLFSISDNGIGIDEKYFDKIFVVFKRLHGTGTYAGTGIGLAICKKIVEKQGGKIWVESVPDKGSTFYFTLKK
jgi:PAS domain S-box-containing protein